jgi:hypothetical protein
MWSPVSCGSIPALLDAKPSTIVSGALAKGLPCADSARAAKKDEGKPQPKARPKAAPKPGS